MTTKHLRKCFGDLGQKLICDRTQYDGSVLSMKTFLYAYLGFIVSSVRLSTNPISLIMLRNTDNSSQNVDVV